MRYAQHDGAAPTWYEASARGRRSWPPLDGNRRADVCVVGGGYTGFRRRSTLPNAGFASCCWRRGGSATAPPPNVQDVPCDSRYIRFSQINLLDLAMRAIQATEAKARLADLLRTVERGETVAITRHGRTIAHVVPARAGEDADRKQAVARFRRRRAEWRPVAMSVDDILLARHRGHRL